MIQSFANSFKEKERISYNKNITESKTVRCGTPDNTLTYSDSHPSITTLCDL